MSAHAGSLFLRLFAAFALFAFAGDIVADSIADLQGDHCICESSQSDSHHEKVPCSHCACAVHNGSAVAFSDAVTLRTHPALHSSLSVVMNRHRSVYGQRLIIRLSSPNN